ncbi:hypothetical protein ACWDRR_00740 [Kitasatospora sp. NPDC003701]
MTEDQTPALGDIRLMRSGDVLVLHPGATDRMDWPRIWDAAGVAFTRGATILRAAE